MRILTICLALLTVLLLIPRAEAESLHGEVSSPITSISPIELMKEPQLQPLGTLARLLVQVPNPCFHGCGYDWGNCTFGVALWREAAGTPIPDNLGNANQWPGNAVNAGYVVSPAPHVGDVGISTLGYYGHAVYIEQVADGQVFLKEMNSIGLGMVDERWAPASMFTYIGQ